MDLNTITPATFKAFFVRDFLYLPLSEPNIGECQSQACVLDSDIMRAFLEAQAVFNQGLFGDDATIQMCYLYLTAHYLVNDLRTGADGVNSQGFFPVQSRTVGSVSESYAIPERYTESLMLSYYTSTSYGMKYLSILIPNLVGNIQAINGGTNP